MSHFHPFSISMFLVYWRAFHYIFHCVEDHLVAESDSAAGRLGRLAQLAACHPQQLAALIYAEERDPAGPSGMGGALVSLIFVLMAN